MSLTKLIKDIEQGGSKYKKHFADPDILLTGLKELDRDVIEQYEVKDEFVKIVKAFVTSKVRNVSTDNDLKHSLLLGGPGIGKTMIARILCKIFVGIGFIGGEKTCTKFPDFDKLRDELLRRRGKDIKVYEIKMHKIAQKINTVAKAAIHARKCLSLLVANPHPAGKQLTSEVSKIISIIEESNTELSELAIIPQSKSSSLEIQADKHMAKTKDDPTLPFKIVNVEDVVSRYVGDTSHRCVEMMNDCLDTVALFDEAYNLCGKSHLSEGYGKTALTTINRYMSEYPDRLVVVFSGYKKDIEENLFSVQEGLSSRFAYRFEMKPYSAAGLTKIYIIALKKHKWNMKDTPELQEIIREAQESGRADERGEKQDLFVYQGRDMYNLATYTKNIYSEKIYDDIAEGKKVSDTITDMEVVKQAVEKFKRIRMSEKISKPGRTLMDYLNA